MIARGAIAVGSTFDGTTQLRSQLEGVANDKWSLFVEALTICDKCDGVKSHPHARSFAAKTYGGGLGCFDLRPRRMADIGVMRGVIVDNSTGRCIVVGEFIAPMTQGKFLSSPLVQYNILLESLRRYDRIVAASELSDGMTRSGALALLHRLGPLGLSKWASHKEPITAALFNRSNGLF